MIVMGVICILMGILGVWMGNGWYQEARTDFNELGEQGWEMCGYDGKYGVAVFKRIKR